MDTRCLEYFPLSHDDFRCMLNENHPNEHIWSSETANITWKTKQKPTPYINQAYQLEMEF